MEFRSTVLICMTFVVTCCTSTPDEWPSKLMITEEIQQDFGIPVGIFIRKDKYTNLYMPPPLSPEYSAEDLLNLQWRNERTRKRYCKVGPYLEGTDFYCKNSTGGDLCCGRNYLCTCDQSNANCKCEQQGVIKLGLRWSDIYPVGTFG